MLAAYGALYIIYIVINVVRPKTMGVTVVAGLNLAIVYGFALIIIAFVLAVIYNVLCTRHERSFETEGKV
jgi:uncharacterized membrane protein (DUF485 family)